MASIEEKSIEKHKELAGKLSVVSKGSVESMDDLALYYSPGVGAVSSLIHKDPSVASKYIGINNSVAIISDGSAVLGLGNIGPKAAMPVMEGKAMLFNRFANIDGYPVVLDVHTADEIVATVKAIAPSYGAVNLEDIAAPICFEVEDRLKAELDIPIMHDDQHGTAVVVLAGLINSMKLVDKELDDAKVVIVGAGAAGTAIAKLLRKRSAKANILVLDSKGIVSKERTDLNAHKQSMLDYTNAHNQTGDLNTAIADADVFVGVSKADLLSKDMVKTMARDAIIFALANPNPEITPADAKEAGAAVIGTGRSDYPNQVNNAVAFPGIFRGALDNCVTEITDDHKIAAAEVIAGLVDDVHADQVIPNVFEERLVEAIAAVIV